jgi:hypothetical protein
MTRLSCHRFRFSLQQRLVKTGAGLVKHARHYLGALDGGSSDEAVVCEHVGVDSGAASSDGVARAGAVGNSVPRPVGHGGI